jgi:hypothetical protein
MRVIKFSQFAMLCISAILCAQAGSAQTCQVRQRNLLSKGVTVGGYYSYSAIGNGLPGSLLSPAEASGTSTFTSSGVGQLLSGLAGTVPFASSGMLFFDALGSILANPTAQSGGTILVGTYVVNSSDCTITVTLSDTFAPNPIATNLQGAATSLQGVVVLDGAEIDLGILQNISTATPSTTTGLYASNTLVKLVRQKSPSCGLENLVGSYALIGAGSRVATVAGTGAGIVPAMQTESPFFLFALVQFDGNGGILAGTTSELSFLQFAGSYTLNPDCTGTMSLDNGTAISSTVSTAQAGSALALNFILIQPETTHGAPAPEIAFTQASGTQTLSGYGVTQ